MPASVRRSLYEELITNDAWSIARQRMGYRSPAGFPLMVMLSGHGFINTRLSFNSFLPQGLSDDVCGKLVNCWLQNLAEKPWLHDKVEFDIAITGFRFDFLETVENLCPGILTEVEKRQLQTLFSEQMSNLLDDNHPGSIAHALGQVDKLPGLYDQWNEHGFPSVEEMIAPVRELGTIQFSMLARHGFWRNRSSGHWLRWVCFRRVERRSSFVRSRRLPPNSPIACRSCKLASCRWSHSTKSLAIFDQGRTTSRRQLIVMQRISSPIRTGE